MNMNNNELNQIRSGVYRFLATLFAKEINADYRDELLADNTQNFLTHLGTDPQFSAEVAIISKRLATLNSERALLELAADYCGLFLVGTKYSASPYAGLYLHNGENALAAPAHLFGDEHQKMVAFLAQSQLEVQQSFPEPADHIAVILAYISHQCILMDNTEQHVFIQANLISWLTRFVVTSQ